VLSLGYRRVISAPADGEHAREWVESGLTFAGFIAFTCKTRADSRAVCFHLPSLCISISCCFQVVQSLQDADHSVSMLTGDALFTSLHVAREVGICRYANSATLKCSHSDGSKPVFVWEIRDKSGAPVTPLLPFEPHGIAALARKYDLLATEADFSAAAASCDVDLWKSSQCVLCIACLT
jgi:magnesium-transporting ATPase (P-type)